MDKAAGSAARWTKEEDRRSGACRDVGVQKRRPGRGQATATLRRRLHRRRPRRVRDFGCTPDPAPISAAAAHGGRRRRARDIDSARDPAAISAAAAHGGRRRRARDIDSARDPAATPAGAAHGGRKRRIRVRVLNRTSAAAARTIHPADSSTTAGAANPLCPHSAPGPAPATPNYISAPTAGDVSASKGEKCFFIVVELFWTSNLTCSAFKFQVQGSGSWNKASMDPIPSDFVLLQGERFLTLQQYRLHKMPVELLLHDRPAGQEEGSYSPRRLCPEAQKFFYQSIHLLDRLIELNVCPLSISSQNIVLCFPDYTPKLSGVQLQDNPNDELIDDIIYKLADIFEDLIRLHMVNIKLPAEVFNMLSIMRAPGPQPNLPLLKVHSCLIPMEHRGHLFVILYQYIIDVLRVFEPSTYRYVIKELVYNKHWEILAECNTYLEKLHDRGHYDPIAARVSTSQIEHLKFQRNGPCHTMQDAADADCPHGLRYTPSSINHALYIISEMLIASIQSALHLMGRLQGLNTNTLFKWD